MYYYSFTPLKTQVKLSESQASAVKMKIVFITARIHPGETVSNYVLRGIIDRFLQLDDSDGKYLRHNVQFVVVPFLNPDGVSIGNYRTSLAGCDLNRKWSNPNKNYHPEVFYTERLIKKLQLNGEIILFIDLHASDSKPYCFVQGIGSNSQVREFPAVLNHHCEHFILEGCKYARIL